VSMSHSFTVLKSASLLAGITCFALVSVSANAAQRMCGERAKINKLLESKYSENPRALGIDGSGKRVFEVYTSKQGTWTVIMTMTNGKSCIMAAGHSWKEEDQVALLPKS